MSHAYTEDQLVERPAIALLAERGWQTVFAMDETFGATGTLQRETKSEVVLEARLRTALTRLNPALPPDAITSAIDALTRDRSAMSLEAANRDLYPLLKEGVKVFVPGRDHEGQEPERVRVIDWELPENNDFLLVNQLSITGPLYTCRTDVVGFVNGLPLVVIELKKPSEPARSALEGNITHYKAQIPALFWYNALIICSNGTDSRVGSITADWDRFFEWKRVGREDEPRRVSLEVVLRGTCDKARLLDLTENFTVFSEHKEGTVKILGQNHQYLGVNNAITSMLEARGRGDGRGGVFWQTQGSGKSFAMVFFAQKVMRKIEGNWTFVVVTDRTELDDQIARTFKATGAVSETEGDECHATTGAHLRELLRGNHRYVFTLIQKFQTPELLSDRHDVVVMTDEAHRSQYDTLALNMRSALPKAMFLAFTGTPLIAGEERTRDVFGDYVSIYDFQQSVEDGATVPLFYENRTPELELINPDLNDDIYDLIEAAELDPAQEARLERELSRQYHILTRDDRLETVAQDIVRHFLGRGFPGKAMVVSIDRATALKMHDKVRAHWLAESVRVKHELKQRGGVTVAERGPQHTERETELTRRLGILENIDMALIVSPGQNEIPQMKALGLDIEPHRRRMNEANPSLDERFKDTQDPLGLVFVCAMWLTGFDAPSCSTVYLDKPMRNHTLMQTIARANRVYPGKHSGLIVDYANVFASLERALALYGAGREGRNPVREKQELVEHLRRVVEAATTFCAGHEVALAHIEDAPPESIERLTLLSDAVNILITPETTRRDYFAHERLVRTLHRAIKPDPAALEFAKRAACITAIGDAIRRKLNPDRADISRVMGDVNALLDDSITGINIREPGPPALDLSKINFEALARRFRESRYRNADLEVLRAAIRAQLERLIKLNRTRTDFAEKLEELIANYNSGSRSIEEFFEELVQFTRELTDEEQRHVREHMTEEELVIFDILTRPAPELSTDERTELKRVARELLTRLKDLLVLNWRQKASARSQLTLAIEDALDAGLPAVYSRELYQQKCSAVFEHFYESYPERNVGIYATA